MAGKIVKIGKGNEKEKENSTIIITQGHEFDGGKMEDREQHLHP